MRRGTGEQGASLIMALAMITIVAVAIVAILTYAATSIRTVRSVRAQRADAYAADSALETAIQFARRSPTLGATADSCTGWSMPLDRATVTCEVLQARIGGTPGMDMPPYAVWSVGTSDAETGISIFRNGTLQVGGPIASNSGAGTVAGISANTLDLRFPPGSPDIGGFTIEARGPCTGDIVVYDPADERCGTGLSYPDPDYPSQPLVGLEEPNPAPICTAPPRGPSGVWQFVPGYYTNVHVFEDPRDHVAPGGSTNCDDGYRYLRPGVYYFDFGFGSGEGSEISSDPVWRITQTVVGGEPKGWNPDSPGSRPPAIGTTGYSAACRTGLDGADSGVQLIFGGESRLDATATTSVVELCADPTPEDTAQQIVIYGLKTGSAPAPQSVRLLPRAWDEPTDFRDPGNLLVIPPGSVPIDGKHATAHVGGGRNGKAAVTIAGFPGAGVPGGSVDKSYTLFVAHEETRPGDVKVLRLRIGACTVDLEPSDEPGHLDTITQDDEACLPAAVQNDFSVTVEIEAKSKKSLDVRLDGVYVQVAYTPPVYRAQGGCTRTDVESCSTITVGKNKATVVVWGTVYVPLGSVYADFKNRSVFQFRRGLIARAVKVTDIPPADSSTSFCLGYATPCVPPARVLRLTATVDGKARVIAIVGFVDAPALGHAANVVSWNVLR